MKNTALHQEHLKLNAKMVPFAGYDMPVQYTGVNDEHMTVRENVGIFDVSHMGQFMISGQYARDLVQKVTSNNINDLQVGQAQYTTLTNEKGGIIDDLIVYKLAEDEYFLVVNASNIEKDFNWIQKQNQDLEDYSTLQNLSDEISIIAIQGPKAQTLLQRLTDVDLGELKFYHFTKGAVNGIDDIIISATGYTGSGGYELYLKNEYASDIWQSLLENGQDLGIKACGLAARDTLRLEKGYCLYGNDINEDTTPLEAGLGWITKLGTGFIGEEPLKEQKEKGIPKKLVAFKMQEKGIPRKDYIVVDQDGNPIGKVTSGTQSPMLKQGIGLAYVPMEMSKIGTTIYIQIRDKNIPAEVVKLPFV